MDIGFVGGFISVSHSDPMVRTLKFFNTEELNGVPCHVSDRVKHDCDSVRVDASRRKGANLILERRLGAKIVFFEHSAESVVHI